MKGPWPSRTRFPKRCGPQEAASGDGSARKHRQTGRSRRHRRRRETTRAQSTRDAAKCLIDALFARLDEGAAVALQSVQSDALKEWAVVCRALETGRQSILLRKGGIDEGPHGFRMRYREFWLLPTRFHEGAESLGPGHASLLGQTQAERPEPGTFRVAQYGVVAEARRNCRASASRSTGAAANLVGRNDSQAISIPAAGAVADRRASVSSRGAACRNRDTRVGRLPQLGRIAE